MIVVKAADSSLTDSEFERLYEIMRIAYALTEIEVWGENYIRITKDDYQELIDKGEILAAFIDNEVVGGVHFYKKSDQIYSFSLLSANFSKSGLGIGRALINQVEDFAKENNAEKIQIEILRPKGIEVPFKIRIANWYKRMGYVYSHSQNFAEIKPIKAKNLVNPSDFDYYTKEI